MGYFTDLFDDEKRRASQRLEEKKTRDHVETRPLIVSLPSIEGWMANPVEHAALDARTLINGHVSDPYPVFGFRPTDGLPMVDPRKSRQLAFA